MTALLPVLILLTSLVPAAITFFLDQESHLLRNALSLGGAVLKVALIVVMLFAVAGGAAYETAIPLAPGGWSSFCGSTRWRCSSSRSRQRSGSLRRSMQSPISALSQSCRASSASSVCAWPRRRESRARAR